MTDKPPSPRLSRNPRVNYDRDRRDNPHRFIDSPDGIGANHLFVDNVARMLGCNVDFVRRIPRHELPASKVGARLIYARQDVEAYIRAHRDAGTAPTSLASGHHAPRTSAPPAIPFDPVAAVRKLTTGKKSV